MSHNQVMTLKIIIILFFTFYLPWKTSASLSICDNYQTPKDYTELKIKIDENIRTFSNKKSIAQRADDTLSKLLSAKSPALIAWMNKRDLKSKSEEEIAREWRNYFARNFILTKYPYGDLSIDKEIETLIDSINKVFSDKKFQEKLENLFKKSKEASLLAIKSMPINEEQMKSIIKRIETIQLYWMKDLKIQSSNNYPWIFSTGVLLMIPWPMKSILESML